MRFSTVAVSALSLATSSLGKEMKQDQDRAARLFDSRVRHMEIMNKKIVSCTPFQIFIPHVANAHK